MHRLKLLYVVRESETRRAVKRISGLIYEETRAVLKNFLEGVSSSGVEEDVTDLFGPGYPGQRHLHGAREAQDCDCARRCVRAQEERSYPLRL